MDATMEATRAPAFQPEMAGSVGAASRTPGWDLATERQIGDGETLAKGLGWFSIGLGMMELLATDRLADWLGLEDQKWLIRAYGVREVAKGVGILSQRRPLGWMWGRVAGDALDLATLGAAFARNPDRRGNIALAMGSVAGVTALDVLCATQLAGNRNQR